MVRQFKVINSALVVFLASFLLQGCNENKAVSVSMIPMVEQGVQTRTKPPWQVVDHKGNEITYYEKRVFLNRGSSFVLSTGEPIRTVEGERIYWNNQGLIITRHGKVINKQDIFELERKVPLPNNHSMTLKNF